MLLQASLKFVELLPHKWQLRAYGKATSQILKRLKWQWQSHRFTAQSWRNIVLCLDPDSKKIDKKAGKEIEEFMTSVYPGGIISTTAAKRPAASSTAAAKRAKVDPTNVDAKQLAASGEVSVE